MPFRLTNLRITAVAAVSDPDNPLAEILLFKRRGGSRRDTLADRLTQLEAARTELAALLRPVEKAEPVTRAAAVARVAERVAALRASDPCTSEVELEARVWEANPQMVIQYREARD